MKYNLLESHKEFARWLVDQHRFGSITDSFVLVFLANGDYALSSIGATQPINKEKRPEITSNTLKALQQESMILLELGSSTGRYYCGLLGRLFLAVDTDFGELESSADESSENLGGIGLNISQLSQILTRDFSLDELKTICHNMNINFESLPGIATIEAKARELVLFSQRHGRLLELLIITAKACPRTDWSSLY